MARYCGLDVALFLLGARVSKKGIRIFTNSDDRILLPGFYCTQLLFQCSIYNSEVFIDQAILFVQFIFALRHRGDCIIACSAAPLSQPPLFYSWSTAARVHSVV